MNEASNIVIILIFGGLGTWLLTGYLKTKKQITIKDKSWNFSRIIFAVAGVMSIVTIIFCQTITIKQTDKRRTIRCFDPQCRHNRNDSGYSHNGCCGIGCDWI